MTKEELARFCSTDETRINIVTPWSKDEYSFATNGHLIVRVPRLVDVPERDAAPSGDKLFPYKEPPEWVRLSDMEIPEAVRADCSECNGDKTIMHDDCSDCNGHNCPECNGKGEVIVDRIPVPVGTGHFQLAYLHMLKELPNCKIGPNADPMDHAVFQFDGGDGLLMPMKHYV